MGVLGGSGDDASGFEHINEDSFLEELVGCGVGHCVAETSLSDFAGGVVYKDHCCGFFWEGVDGVDFFWAVDCVGDGCEDIASGQAYKGCGGGEGED